MTEKNFREIMENVKPGVFTRIKYKSDASLAAKAKKEGHTVTKIVDKTVRFGVNYFEIESVKEREAARTEPKKEMRQLYESLIPNTLYKHIEKETLYVQFATIPEGGHTITEWLIDGNAATLDQVKESGYVINSYWNKSGDAPEVQKIKLENVISIGG
ncbi:MAG: hypothetical protein J6R47_04205 [Acholeplasmatales bacterium]|nr:hypothetical protein [Acholeplasmatales bacterium]